MLRSDFASRLARGKQERFAAKVTWEAIQRVELCETVAGTWEIMRGATAKLGCDHLRLICRRDGLAIFEGEGPAPAEDLEAAGSMSGPTATFRLSSGRDLILIVSLHQAADSALAADIAFRFMQRLSLASAERLDRLFSTGPEAVRPADAAIPAAPRAGRVEPAPNAAASTLELVPMPSARPPTGWLRDALGWSSARVAPGHPLGEE